MELFMIDAIGPFFRGYSGSRINWSKIPFSHLSFEPGKRRTRFDRIGADMETFCAGVRKTGYNAVSLDDVAHLVQHPWLEPEINRNIGLFREEYRALFLIIKRYGLKIFLTMDVLSFTPRLKERINNRKDISFLFLKEQVETLFFDFPEISGVILRIGESDGLDVKGDFRSELILQSPADVNRMLRELLPVFEKFNRYLILRTWTVGAYRVGDLIWHRGTIARVLRGIDSPCFILSMKYGESDFFRYLPLNKHFYRVKVRKIIELQARREYEGCGEYPSFIGWDYHEYARQLEKVDTMIGISVWCQTGGWVPFKRLTYLQPEGIWNELNSHVTLKLFKERMTVEEAVSSFAAETGCVEPEKLIRLLRLSDEVIKELLYIEEIAGRKLFFRRVRIPPLISVYWNNILINHSVKKVLRSLAESPEKCIETGYQAMEKLKEMKVLASELQLPVEDIEFMTDTFYILVLARSYYFAAYDEDLKKQIKKAKKSYKKKYPKSSRPRYRIKTNFTPVSVKRRHIALLLRMMLRNKRGYRLVDYLFTLHLLGTVYRLVIKRRPKMVPGFARKKTMGIDTIFR